MIQQDKNTNQHMTFRSLSVTHHMGWEAAWSTLAVEQSQRSLNYLIEARGRDFDKMKSGSINCGNRNRKRDPSASVRLLPPSVAAWPESTEDGNRAPKQPADVPVINQRGSLCPIAVVDY